MRICNPHPIKKGHFLRLKIYIPDKQPNFDFCKLAKAGSGKKSDFCTRAKSGSGRKNEFCKCAKSGTENLYGFCRRAKTGNNCPPLFCNCEIPVHTARSLCRNALNASRKKQIIYPLFQPLLCRMLKNVFVLFGKIIIGIFDIRNNSLLP